MKLLFPELVCVRVEKIAYLWDENRFGSVSHIKYSPKENGSFMSCIFKTDLGDRYFHETLFPPLQI